jgi:hypothetical protein
MRVPACFLCHKELYKGDGEVVTFADYVQPEDLMCEEPPGFECFCNEHLAAAQALSHLTSQEALLQLQQQFGTFEDPVIVPPPLTRWQRFCEWFWNKV